MPSIGILNNRFEPLKTLVFPNDNFSVDLVYTFNPASPIISHKTRTNPTC